MNIVTCHVNYIRTVSSETHLRSFHITGELNSVEQRVNLLALNCDNKIAHTNIFMFFSGFVEAVDAYVCGTVSHSLGAGRVIPQDKIDYSAGIKLCVKVGSQVTEGKLELHCTTLSIIKKFICVLMIAE
jgi:thymidine phosphorylase